MKKLIVIGSAISALGGILSVLIYNICGSVLAFSLTVTFFTTLYHFVMRILAARLVVIARKNKTDDKNFKISEAEEKFYKIIGIKKWKKYAPTYDTRQFCLKDLTHDEIIHNMTNAEIGHGAIVVLSFVPILFSKAAGGFWAFLITSVLAAVFDLQFVLIQRFNKSRMSRIMEKEKKKR